MRTISIYFLSFTLTLSVYGCFGSRERGDKIDSGFNGADVTIETGGAGGKDISSAGSGGIDGGHAAVGGGVARPFDAGIIDVIVVQAGIGGFGGAGGTGGIDTDDDAGMSNAPCAPNCPDLEWVTIPGGTFIMGSPEGVGLVTEHPQHEVTVQTFKMSKTEVTVVQYGSCVDAGICSDPESNSTSLPFNWGMSGRENHPINTMNWIQAREFAEWLGGRLPSEAEWEYAARSGGRDIAYPWGNEDATCEHAVIFSDESENECGNNKTAEVCSKPVGNTAQGLCDMAGNVSEWVEDDWHNSYSGAPLNGQAWIDSPRSYMRVKRGGSWGSRAVNCRSAVRGDGVTGPTVRNFGYFGSRVVLDIE